MISEYITGWMNGLISGCLMILSLCLLGAGVYSIYDSVYIYYRAADPSLVRIRPDAEDDSWTERRPEDAAAWITIDGTGIDYPVMQGTDNVQYINQDPFGNFSLAGSVFLDYRCSRDFTDNYSLLYGHHMEGGFMFGALDAFEDPEYFARHREGRLITCDKNLHLTLFAVLKTDASETVIFNPEKSSCLLELLREKASVFYEPAGSRILAMSTCTDAMTTSRMVVFGALTERKTDENY